MSAMGIQEGAASICGPALGTLILIIESLIRILYPQILGEAAKIWQCVKT